jgi:protein-serine/threonine kinase
MTQLFGSSSNSPTQLPTEKRNFSGFSMSSSKNVNGSSSNSHFPQKLKNFFRINSLSNSHNGAGSSSSTKLDTKQPYRQSRFLGNIGRSRSPTVVSEGGPLDEGISPTAHANPYFAHQGPPAIRHHNEGSVPSSPTDTPIGPKADGDGSADDQATVAGKEELARKLRRVASAPNAQGLFINGKSNDRPKTAELGKETPPHNDSSTTLGTVEKSDGNLLPVPTADGIPSAGQIRNAVAFRRTYSSNSIKVRNVEVGPSSFDKIKLIGKGDVGKVYLVREKKSSRLYAMKGGVL